MNVCIVQASVTLDRGSGRYAFDLATRMAEDGVRVTLLCHEYDDRLCAVANLELIPVPRAHDGFGMWRLGHAADLWNLRRRLPALLAGRSFDALIGSDLLFLSAARRVVGGRARFIYTPLSMIAPLEISSYQLSGARHAIGVRLYRQLQRWALRDCDVVVRFTPSAVRALEEYYQLDLGAKALASVYVSREFESGGSDHGELPMSRPTPPELLWVGGLIKSKNVEFLLRALALIRHQPWILNICSDGPERRFLEKTALTLGIADRTRFRGRVDDLAAEYRRASVLLTASVLEQYSLTLMEAYSFAVPCIGLAPDWKTVFNSNEDQIRDGETGYVVRSEREMAARVEHLLVNEAERQRLARNAYEMKQRFRFEDFYQSMQHAMVG